MHRVSGGVEFASCLGLYHGSLQDITHRVTESELVTRPLEHLLLDDDADDDGDDDDLTRQTPILGNSSASTGVHLSRQTRNYPAA